MKKPKRRLMWVRVEAIAVQAHLAIIFMDQGDIDGFNTVLSEIAEALEEDKKLSQHLFPGLAKLCKEKNLEIHGHHVAKKEKH